MIKLLCGGSPCTYWSIAQTKNRETEASGLGWELFLNYRIARDKYQPDYFLYENNKSMAKAIRDKITEELGVEPVLINSALVSAQNRQRLYWVGKRNPDGTYSQVDIEQPEDRGILLRDILETGVPWREKSYTLDANYWKTAGVYNPEKQHSKTRHMAAEAVCVAQRGRNPDNPKSREVGLPTEQMLEAKADYKTNTLTTVQKDNMVAEPLCTADGGKSFCITSTEYKGSNAESTLTKHRRTMVCEPICAEPLCTTSDGKSFNLTTSCQNAIPEDTIKRHRHSMVCEPVNITEDGKSQCLRATCYKDGIRNMVGNDVDRKTCVAEPVCMRYERTDEAKRLRKQYEAHEIHHGYHEYHELHPREDGKSNTLSTVLKDNQICEPVRVGTIESTAKNADFDSQQYRVYSQDGKSVTLCGQGGGVGAKTGLYATPIDAQPMRVPEATKKGYCDIQPGDCVDLAQENSKTRRGRSMSTKSNCMTTSCEFYEYCGTLDKPIYTVKNGIITIKDKQYPIKLRDGCYIIRKLTVTECKRLQTVPDSYEFPVSDTQGYKMLGNGWTCDVIAHIMSRFDGITTEPIEVLSMYDGMSCGHIALDKLGAGVTKYYATEIDKYAIKTTQHNYPDTIQLGDAFQVRDWPERWNGQKEEGTHDQPRSH